MDAIGFSTIADVNDVLVFYILLCGILYWKNRWKPVIIRELISWLHTFWFVGVHATRCSKQHRDICSQIIYNRKVKIHVYTLLKQKVQNHIEQLRRTSRYKCVWVHNMIYLPPLHLITTILHSVTILILYLINYYQYFCGGKKHAMQIGASPHWLHESLSLLCIVNYIQW